MAAVSGGTYWDYVEENILRRCGMSGSGFFTEVLTAAKIPQGGLGGFGAYAMPVSIVGGQWMWECAGGNPGVSASWSVYPDTGWVGVVLANRDADGVSPADIVGPEMQAITGVAPGGGSGG